MKKGETARVILLKVDSSLWRKAKEGSQLGGEKGEGDPEEEI